MTRIEFDILRTMEKHADIPLSESRVLDIGCWDGRLSLPLAKKVKSITGVDIRRSPAFKGKNITFVKSDALAYLKKSIEWRERFDIIICSEVIEHIDGQEKFLIQLKKALSGEGILYLTTNNKYWWKEGHYGLPFLTYLPESLQKKYIQLFKKERGLYQVTNLFSYRALKGMLKKAGYKAKFIMPEGLNFPYNMFGLMIKGPLWNLSPGFMVIAKKG